MIILCNRKLDPIIPHRVVHHADREYAWGSIHTNTIEGFRSIVNQQLNADIFGAAIKAC